MKKLILTILLLTTTIVVCDAQSVTSSMNSIVTTTPTIKVGSASQATTSNSIVQVDYFDGLGRHVQTVLVHGSSSDTDLATRQVYDKYGQVTENWLPVPASRNYGAYVSSFDSKSKSAYSNDSRAYTKTEYEPSPLARPVAVYSPGTEMASHPATIKYATNKENEVIKYAMSGERIVKNGTYAAGTLFVQIDADQDGCTTKTYTDKLGNTILERRLNGSETYDTYYVYSNFDSNTKKYNHTNLCAVLPPGCNESNYTDAAYIYRYDERRRCIYKKIPGADPVTYVYDNADRLTYSQDGEQRKRGKYTYYVYDQFCRVTSQGECNDTKGNGKTSLVFYSYDSYQFLQDPRCSGLKSGTGNVKGLKTGAIISVLGSPSGVQCEVYSYDYRGRLTKTEVKDVYGMVTTYTTDYNFNNQPIQQKEEYTAQKITKITDYSYDSHGRLTSEITTVKESGTTKATAQVQFGYSPVGRLSSKTIGTSNPKTINYQYTTQGLLLSAANDIFTEKLYYNTSTATNAKKYFNGNISAIYWKHSGQSANTTIFGYDKLNRLVNSTMLVGAPYTETGFSYDERGNISGFTRTNGSNSTKYYLTHSSTNHLVIANTDKGQFWGFSYDSNGNQTTAPNNFTITYNQLNQPQQVKSGSTVKQKFAYLADGRKFASLDKIKSADNINKDGGLAYVGSSVFIIKEGKYDGFESTNFSAGRIVRSGSDYAVQYHITDHLGSVRVVLDANMKVLEQNDYYPFGLRHPNAALKTTANRYRYNGKEEISSTNTSDYGARQYSAEFCQWMQVDPLSEKFYSTSAYGFCAGNPLRYVDPDGLAWRPTYMIDGVGDKVVNGFEWVEPEESYDDNGKLLEGLYEAVVWFQGSRDERLGKGDNLFGEGAKLAKATVYGPSGEDDIMEYDAFTMSSDFATYGAIADGDYTVNYRIPGKSGSLKSNWAVNDTKPVDCLDGINPSPLPDAYSSTQKDQIYIHRSNNDGSMLPNGTPVSTGCIIIVPSRQGRIGWNEFNQQLSGVSSFHMRLTRD